jgi:hypothetical protein
MCPLSLALVCCACVALLAAPAISSPVRPVVEAEEDVFPVRGKSAPLHPYGSTFIVRTDEGVFVSAQLPITPGYFDGLFRLALLQRTGQGWAERQHDPDCFITGGCPMACDQAGNISILTTYQPITDRAPDSESSPPRVLRFSARQPQAPFEASLPPASGEVAERAAYPGFAADGETGELLATLSNWAVGMSWAFRDARGAWSAHGLIPWPYGAEYAEPRPIRLCYPVVALKGRAAYIFAVSDIPEPIREWAEYEKAQLGQTVYDFRRVYFTWTPDITATPFHPWKLIANREATGGDVNSMDIWVAPDGLVYLLWRECTVTGLLRDRFFPQAKIERFLKYGAFREGRLVSQYTLAHSDAERAPTDYGELWARFHALPDGRLLIFMQHTERPATGGAQTVNRLLEVGPEGQRGPAVDIPLEHPFGGSNTVVATWRAGCRPADTLDILGPSANQTMRYACVRLR